MKLFKDVSFWCIILTILIVMIIHNILTSDKIIEGQDNMDGEKKDEENNDQQNNNDDVISMMMGGNSEPHVEAVIELSLGRNKGNGLSGKASTVGATVATVDTVDTVDNVDTVDTVDSVDNDIETIELNYVKNR